MAAHDLAIVIVTLTCSAPVTVMQACNMIHRSCTKRLCISWPLPISSPVPKSHVTVNLHASKEDLLRVDPSHCKCVQTTVFLNCNLCVCYLTPDQQYRSNVSRHAQDFQRFVCVVLQGHKNWVQIVSWSPDAAMLASGDQNGVIWLWQPKTGETIGACRGES